MSRLGFSLLAASVIPFLAWIGGWGAERGFASCLVAVFSVLSFVLVYFDPSWTRRT